MGNRDRVKPALIIGAGSKYYFMVNTRGVSKLRSQCPKISEGNGLENSNEKNFICEEIIIFRRNCRIDLNICRTDIQVFLFLRSTIRRPNFEKLY